YAELWVAATLVCLGLAVLRAVPALKSIAAPLFFGAAGVVHGYAYGESVVGAQPAPLLAYLVGFTLVQFVVGLGGFALARYAARMQRSAAMLRTVGATASVAGVPFMLLALGS